MKLGDVLHDRQPETGPAKRPAAFLMNPVETLENARLILLGDPAAVIGYGENGVVVFASWNSYKYC